MKKRERLAVAVDDFSDVRASFPPGIFNKIDERWSPAKTTASREVST
jgi:hypothetical protein